MFDFYPFLTDTYAIVLAATMMLAFVVLALYYGLTYLRVGRHGLKKRATDAAEATPANPPVSVVLTAHNDAAWLKENLVYLLEQDYPKFEVVVVDYLSSDDTEYVLRLLKDYYPHLKTVPFKEDVNLFQGKKYPLSIGIKSASYDILLLADPECTPKNLQWLRGMVRGYGSGDTKIVLGYCGLKRNKTLLGALQQYDALSYGAHYIGNALAGHPYTGSGRNLSYRRSFFFEQGAFIRHYDVADGSDDLFVYQNASRNNTAVCIDADAVLMSEPMKSFAEWHRRRRHRVGTRNRHSLGSRLVEELPPLSVVVFYTAAVLLILDGSLPWVVTALVLALKIAWQTICFANLSKRFEGGVVYLFAPLFEIYFTLANTILILLPLSNNRRFR